MAVFRYRGLVAATGKNVSGFRDADNAKVLRAALKREGVMLTSAEEDRRGKGGASQSSSSAESWLPSLSPSEPSSSPLPRGSPRAVCTSRDRTGL